MFSLKEEVISRKNLEICKGGLNVFAILQIHMYSKTLAGSAKKNYQNGPIRECKNCKEVLQGWETAMF